MFYCIFSPRPIRQSVSQSVSQSSQSVQSVQSSPVSQSVSQPTKLSFWIRGFNCKETMVLHQWGVEMNVWLNNRVMLTNSDIEQVDSQKLLGVTIDKHLSFDVHVEELCKKLSQRIAVLRKIRRFILIEQRILYYNAMIKQVMLYGSTIWSNCSADNLTRILKLQKRTARVILGADTR